MVVCQCNSGTFIHPYLEEFVETAEATEEADVDGIVKVEEVAQQDEVGVGRF